MISKILRIAFCILFAFLAACADISSFLYPPTPAPVPHTTATPQPPPPATQTISSSGNEPHVLRIWLPKRFDPNGGAPPAKLLLQRLTDFRTAHPGLDIELRIKDEIGETSLLNTLTMTSLAAPSALPDLIALSRADLEAAALKGLLHPIDGLSTMLHDSNWYAYARELGHVENIGYGLPFVGNVLVLVHLPETKFDSWEDIFAEKQTLLFPAGDSRALFIMSLYASAGGEFVDDQGQLSLQEAPLTRAFNLIQTGIAANTFSPSLIEYKADEQTLQAYRNGLANAAITWSANHEAADGTIQLIPPVSTPSTFADGWVWALAGAAPENQQLATELAEYLMEEPFLTQWTTANGYYSTRLNQDSAVNEILDAAQALPPGDVLTTLGPILNQALSRIMGGEQVEVVVRSVMDEVK